MNGTGSLRSHPSPISSEPCVAVDRGIPMPSYNREGGRPAKWPWRRMEIGDSFVMREHVDRLSTVSVSTRITGAQKATGRKFSQRKVEENGKLVIRVWRTA